LTIHRQKWRDFLFLSRHFNYYFFNKALSQKMTDSHLLRFGEKNTKRTGVLVREHTLCGLRPSKTPSNLQYFSAKNQSEFVTEPLIK